MPRKPSDFRSTIMDLTSALGLTKMQVSSLLGISWSNMVRWQNAGAAPLSQLQQEILAVLKGVARQKPTIVSEFRSKLEIDGPLVAIEYAGRGRRW